MVNETRKEDEYLTPLPAVYTIYIHFANKRKEKKRKEEKKPKEIKKLGKLLAICLDLPLVLVQLELQMSVQYSTNKHHSCISKK